MICLNISLLGKKFGDAALENFYSSNKLVAMLNYQKYTGYYDFMWGIVSTKY